MKLTNWEPELEHCPECGGPLRPALEIVHPLVKDPDILKGRYCKPCNMVFAASDKAGLAN